jgi:hypothetical protein
MDVIYQKNRESRQGIALIMVVGMLALMMVMAVAFAIFMRTERATASSFRTDVRARNLLQVALSRAVDAIDASMGTTNYPPWDALYSGGGSYVREALTKNALDQIPLAALTPQGTCVAGAANYVVIAGSVPSGDKGAVINLTDHSFGLITNVVSVGGGNNQVFHTALSGGKNNTWASGVDKYYVLQPAMDDLPPTVGGGRFGYVVINCSGLPDANRVGGGVRSIGTNVTEIQLSSLPGGVNPALLVSERATPFETHQELIARGMANGVFSGYPDAFVCYSSAVTNDDRIYIGGGVSNLVAKQSEIIAKLQNMMVSDPSFASQSTSFSLTEAGILFTNLVDFIDADVIPGNLGNPASLGNPAGPYVERIPMANEIVLSNRVVYTLNMAGFPAATNYLMTGFNKISVEFASPIVVAAAMPNFKWEVALEGVSGNAKLFPAQGSQYTNLTLSPMLGSLSPLTVKEVSLPMVGDPVPGPIPASPLVNQYTARVMTKFNTTTVDVVTNIGVALTVSTAISPNGGTVSGVYTQYLGEGAAIMECIDPRVNDVAGAWAYKAGRPNTLGTTNFQALLRLFPYTYGSLLEQGNYGPRSRGKDGDTVMYVANAPLNSVGDMGYLFYGNSVSYAWETVRLFRVGADGTYGKTHPVLDYFTIDIPGAGIPKGKINPNGQNADILKATFSGIPLNRRHSTVPVTSTLSPAQLDAVATAIIGKTSTNAIDSLAEIGEIRWDMILPTLSSLDKESLIRNSCEVLNTRQNFFVVLLYADVTKTDIAGNSASLSSIVGLAEVWRDPSTNTHPVNVHYFQIMEAQ